MNKNWSAKVQTANLKPRKDEEYTSRDDPPAEHDGYQPFSTADPAVPNGSGLQTDQSMLVLFLLCDSPSLSSR